MKSADVIRTTGFASALRPRAVSTRDLRMKPAGATENVLGRYFRSNVTLAVATVAVASVNGVAVDPPAVFPSGLVEYKLPNHELVLLQPGPAMFIVHNRAELLPYESPPDSDGEQLDPGVFIPEACYWTYRAVLVDGTREQRLRVQADLQPGDFVRAAHYIVDFTVV